MIIRFQLVKSSGFNKKSFDIVNLKWVSVLRLLKFIQSQEWLLCNAKTIFQTARVQWKIFDSFRDYLKTAIFSVAENF